MRIYLFYDSIITLKRGKNMESKNRKFKLYKKFIAITLATSTILGGAYLYNVRKNNKRINSMEDYKIGYEDIGLLSNKITNKVTRNNFLLLDIGDHNNDGIYFLKQKLQYCQKNGVDVGLIISSNSKELADIYLDLEFVKKILTEYNINYPIYLNLDCILENEDLSLERATTLIDSFLQKASENHIYIGVLGKKENILAQYSTYTKIITDEPTDSDIVKNGNIYYASLNLKNTIITEKYQQSNCFTSDEYHVVEKNENLKDIARDYQLSVTDLKKYNHIDFLWDTPKEGDILTIPSLTYQENNHLNDTLLKFGIDVSRWQGQINWQEVDVDYAIIQIKDFINQENDPMFLTNIEGCIKNNIPMGFYAFSRATTIDELKIEANYIIKQIQNYPVEYPIYLDLETDFWHSINEEGRLIFGNYTGEETQNFVTKFIKTWEKIIEAAGYTPGIYCNQGLYDKLNLVTNNYIQKLSCWVAGGEIYDQEIIYESKDKLPKINETSNIAMKQISQKGKIIGIDEYVDINYCYLDYETLLPPQPQHSFYRLEHELEIGSKFIVASGILLFIHKRKHKKRNRRRDFS